MTGKQALLVSVALVCAVGTRGARAGDAAPEALAVRGDAAGERYTIYEGARPVLTYNFGTIPVPQGVSGQYAVARSNYVHPLYGPNGEVLTKDYSPDHPHHRGIYWAWPEVSYKGETRDLHALQGVFARPVRIVRQEATADSAVIEAENVWKWGDQEAIVREFATIRASRWKEGSRVVDFQFRFVALEDGVTVARRGKEHYGGLNIRLSPRANQKITPFTDPPELPARRAWGDLCGIPPDGKMPLGVAILQNVANPAYPGDWYQVPNLNWLQPTFPAAKTAFALKRDEPLLLSYRLVIHEGEWGTDQLASAWASYNPQTGSRLSGLAHYRFGESRRALIAIEGQVAQAGAAERLKLEADLAALLTDARATPEIKCWVCGQLERIGTAASVPALAGLLGDAATCLAACGALRAIPGNEAEAALTSALEKSGGAQQMQIVATVGHRRIEGAVPQLGKLARGADGHLACAAMDALAEIGSPGAARVLAELSPPAQLSERFVLARLRCAQRLNETGHGAEAAAVCKPLCGAETPARHRSAALVGLARANPADAAPLALVLLEDPDKRLLGAASAVLTSAAGNVSRTLAEALPKLAPATQVVVLRILADRRDASVAADAAKLAVSESEEVQGAALETLGILGNAEHVELLAERAAKGGALGKKAVEALNRLKGDAVGRTIQELAASGKPVLRPVLLDCMAARGDPGAAETLLRLCRTGDDATASAACAALGRAATPAHLGELVKLLDELPKARAEAGRAILAVCGRAEDRDSCAAVILSALDKASAPAAAELLRLLPSLGGERALNVLRQAAQSNDAALKDAAVRGLTDWRDARVVPDLLAVLKDGGSTDVLRILALRGLVRLSESAETPAAEKLKALAQALDASRRPEEKKLVASGLGKVKDPGAVQLLAKLLDDAEVRTEAATAIAAASLPGKDGPGLAGKAVAAALKRAKDCLAGTELAKQIGAYLDAMPSSPNLALKRPVQASHPCQGNLVPELAVDGKVSPESYWSCAHTPSWLQVDLGRVAKLDKIRLHTYWDGTRYYQYTIEVSPDGKEWKPVADQRTNTNPAVPDGNLLKIGPAEARYIRVNMLKNSANPGVHIVELQAFEVEE